MTQCRAPKLFAILGPTAAGKSRMALEVCDVLAGLGRFTEIVSCDSMAVYRGLDVVADKPSDADRERVPHHLIDVVDPDEEFTVVEYRDLAREAIAQIASRDAVPMLVGGSGLYFRGVVDELSFAPTSPALRARLEAQDPRVLFDVLQKADPAGAKQLDPRNVRRVVRAVEVLELTGRAPSEVQREWRRRGERYDLTAVCLTWDRSILYERAAQRVDRQLEAGLVDEIRRVTLSKTSGQALGVKEAVSLLEGQYSLEDVRSTLVRNVKVFIRRQLSWFRADPRLVWVDASELGWDNARTRIVDRFVGGS